MKHFVRAEIEERPSERGMMGSRAPVLKSPRFLRWHAVPVGDPDGETLCGRARQEDPKGDYRDRDFSQPATGGVPKCLRCLAELAHVDAESESVD